MSNHPQLTLSLDTAPATSFDSFHLDTCNELVHSAVSAFVRAALDDIQLYLWGDAGTGKSHLLMAACDFYHRQGYRVAYLSGDLINQSGSLEGMDSFDLLCIDDLQRLDHAAEVELFHLINRVRAAGNKLLFAADRPIDSLGLALKDLQTRLVWGLVYKLDPLTDDGLANALRQEIENRSLYASDEVISYVLKHFPRRMNLLKQVVDTLDNVSLLEQRRITVPLIKSVFGEAERAELAGRMR